MVKSPNLPAEFKHDLEDLLSREIEALLAMAEPDRPFSALVQKMIDDNGPLG